MSLFRLFLPTANLGIFCTFLPDYNCRAEAFSLRRSSVFYRSLDIWSQKITNFQFTISNEFSMIQCLKIEKLRHSMKIEN